MGTIVPERRSVEGVLLHFFEKRPAVDAQAFGRLGAMPAVTLQGQGDDFFLLGLNHVLEIIFSDR